MFHFSHRVSKDIDIFFIDKQRLAAVSPRVNDGVEDALRDYIEQDGFCKLYFPEGKIDFIYSRKISEYAPQPCLLAGRMVQCDDPVEIVAKKVFWRNDRVTPRDIFDLAVVYNADK
jgi:predicted nucleotidyltransferase component of viral defense system